MLEPEDVVAEGVEGLNLSPSPPVSAQRKEVDDEAESEVGELIVFHIIRNSTAVP